MKHTSSLSLLSIIFLSLLVILPAARGLAILNTLLQVDNNEVQRTSLYRYNGEDGSTAPLIVRRGASFSGSVTLDFPLPAGLSFRLSFLPRLPESDYEFKIVSEYPNIRFTVELKPNASIGSYSVSVEVVSGEVQFFRYRVPNRLIILFNPLNPQDEVYFPDTSKLEDYLFSEYGTVWTGSVKKMGKERWYYAQFDYNSLLSALHVVSQMPEGADRSDPVQVSRWLSYFITYQDGNQDGVMEGRWTDDFTPYTPPTSWTGSNEITSAYVKGGFKTVRYAQCWVFSGLFTTLLRSLGLVSRQIYNFESVHEKAKEGGVYTQDIEIYIDADGKTLSQEQGSVWNFHSWNEVWINNRRDDEQGGWQALDSTPQEKSDGAYRMGPAPVSAVRSFTNVKAKYDVSFVRSMVAASIKYDEYNCDDVQCYFRRTAGTSNAGVIILTSDFMRKAKRDITSTYKIKTNWRPFDKRAILDDGGRNVEMNIKFLEKEFGKILIAETHVIGGKQGPMELRGDISVVDYRDTVVEVIKNISLPWFHSSSSSFSSFSPSSSAVLSSSSLTSILRLKLNPADYVDKIRDNHLKFSMRAYSIDSTSSSSSPVMIGNVKGDLHLRMPELLVELMNENGRVIATSRDQQKAFTLFSIKKYLAETSSSFSSPSSRKRRSIERSLPFFNAEDDNNINKELPPPEVPTTQTLIVRVSYFNPLPTPLENIMLRYNGGRMALKLKQLEDDDDVVDEVSEQTLKIKKMEGRKEFSREFVVQIPEAGPHSLMFSLVSHQTVGKSFLDLIAV